MSELSRTALYALHLELGAKMVPFAGYAMPVQYPLGVLREHQHTRTAAGLFDVSHMGQLRVSGAGAARALESLVPVDVIDLPVGQQRYALLTNESGGILDDLMIANTGSDFFVVVNAACKAADTAHIRAHIGAQCDITELPDQALLALQGPKAVEVMQRLNPDVDFSKWLFMHTRALELAGAPCYVSRSGYTGEDGFEISVPNADALAVARLLLAQPEVAAIGLGARDSLRLEAGLCLYGHDLDAHTTPVESSLVWALSKARRADGARAGGYPGAQVILSQLAHGVARKRVGLIGMERTPVREGAQLFDASGAAIGHVTSGGFGPTLAGAIAIGYVASPAAAMGYEVHAEVRGKKVPMRVVKTPFVANRYFRG
jgi:aminomethyltransferase